MIGNSLKTIHCGGVLVCSSWVITTASCLKQLEQATSPPIANEEVFVYLNIQDGNDLSSAEEQTILEIIYHPLFIESKYSADKKIGHDIAAIKIRTSAFHPICLPNLTMPEPKFNILMETRVWTFGFGPKDGTTDPGQLKIEKFKIAQEEDCKTAYKSVDFTGAICTSAIQPTADDAYATPISAVSKVGTRLLFSDTFGKIILFRATEEEQWHSIRKAPSADGH